ncbi:MAG: glycosyltransferase family 2 protein [Sedimentitalea sp.]
MRYLAILTQRNEGAFLLDWLAHHRAVGFDHFLIYSNICQDGSDAMLDALAEQGWLTHIRNDGPYDKAGIQFTALKHAAKLGLLRKFDWILPLDVDEYVNIHTGDGTVSALTAALPDASAITLTWRLFGNADTARYADTPVTEAFTWCAPYILNWPWRASMFKTLYRNDGTYAKPGIHRPRSPDRARLDHSHWYDAHGRKLDDQFKTRRIFSNYGRPNYGLAQLNHYPLGAMESYVLKADRGRAVHGDDLLGVDYWVERNFNIETDTTIKRMRPKSDVLRAAFHDDPALAARHRDAVDWRKARFHELMEKEPFRALFARLLMTPPSRPVTRQSARMLTQFANKGRANSEQ